MPLQIPHTFVDGPGNVASGEQVSENFTAVRNYVNALEALTVKAEAFRWHRLSSTRLLANDKVTWDAEGFDFMAAAISPAQSIPIGTPGVWAFSWRVGVEFGASDGVQRTFQSRLFVGSTMTVRGSLYVGTASNVTVDSSGSALLNLPANAQVSVAVDGSLGTIGATPQVGPENTFIQGHLVRRA